MATLDSRRIALLESRHGGDLATLVRRLGGEPVSAPAVDEVPCHNDFNTFLNGLVERRFSLAIFQTGTGIRTLFTEAERRGRLAHDFRLRGSSGAYHWFRLKARPVIGTDGEVIRIVGTLSDDDERLLVDLLHRTEATGEDGDGAR